MQLKPVWVVEFNASFQGTYGYSMCSALASLRGQLDAGLRVPDRCHATSVMAASMRADPSDHHSEKGY